jgi:hypothetical protein
VGEKEVDWVDYCEYEDSILEENRTRRSFTTKEAKQRRASFSR